MDETKPPENEAKAGKQPPKGEQFQSTDVVNPPISFLPESDSRETSMKSVFHSEVGPHS